MLPDDPARPLARALRAAFDVGIAGQSAAAP
jgi:hypothetical protein